jgi:hypothetical protein
MVCSHGDIEMKDILLALLRRNGIIIGIYVIAMIILMFIPQYAMGAGFWVMMFLMVGLIWANGMLTSHMSRLLAALLTAVITLVIGGGMVLLTIQAQRLCGR